MRSYVRKFSPYLLDTVYYLTNIKIGIIGLGYVGLPLAIEFAKKNEVIGFDIDFKRVAQLKSFEDKTLEVEKSELTKLLL